MKQPPEDWLTSSNYQILQAQRALKDAQSAKDPKGVEAAYRAGWEAGYGAVEKSIKAAAPYQTETLGPAFDRTHELVRPLGALKHRYREITDAMVEEARWMEKEVGYDAKYPNGKPVGREEIQKATKLAQKLAAFIGRDPRRGLV